MLLTSRNGLYIKDNLNCVLRLDLPKGTSPIEYLLKSLSLLFKGIAIMSTDPLYN